MLSYLAVVFIPLSIGSVLFINSITESVRTEYLNSVLNNLRQIEYNVFEKIIVGFQVGKNFATDNRIQLFIYSDDTSDKDIVETINRYIVSWMDSSKLLNPTIYKIKILHENSSVYNIGNSLVYVPELNGKLWREKLASLKGLPQSTDIKYFNIYYEPSHKENIYDTRAVKYSQDITVMNSRKNVYTLYFPVYYNYNLNDYIGIIEVDILEETLLAPLLNTNVSDGDFIATIDEGTGEVLYCSKESLATGMLKSAIGKNNYSQITIDDKAYYIVKIYNKYLDRWCVQFVSMESVLKWRNYKSTLIIWIIISAVILGGISWMLSKGMLNKLLKLTRAINRIKQGDLETKLAIQSSDEIGVIALNFNEMTEKIRKLMTDIQLANNAEKEAIYRALENQIKPHFLCNALDMVRMMAETRNEQDIVQSVESITNYFMYNLAHRDKYVTLDVELKNVKDYISIHNMIRNKAIELEIRLNANARNSPWKVLQLFMEI